MRSQVKRGIEANLGNVTLADGEFAVTTDTKKLYVGIAGSKICLGGASSLGDMLKSIYDTNNNGIVDYTEAIKFYATANSSSGYVGQYTKIASVTLTYQYQEANTILALTSSGSGNGTQVKGFLFLRVKQQNAMGEIPVYDLKLSGNEFVSSSNFVAVITVNSTSATTVELYYKAAQSYDSLVITPLYNNGVLFYEGQSYSNSLPSGTQIACASMAVEIANKLATARTITITGDVTGSANFDGSANISISTTLKTGLTWNDLKGV